MMLCNACGQESPDGFRFCGACGSELPSPGVRREVRKTVTVVFCDVTGSTSLGERLDPEAMRATMGRYFDEIRRIIERHGGMVEKFIGDAVMAVFGIPVAHEDDALRAVRAVSEIRVRLAALGDELSVALSFRTGVNTGEVVAGEGETLVTGDAVNVAARLEQAAPTGEVLIGAETLALVRDAVTVEAVEPLALKGKREPVPAFRLVSVDMAAEAFARRLDAPLVGRVREQQRLRTDFDVVVLERECHLFTLLGTAGVGKSRLVAALLSGVGQTADILRSRCLHYGEDITYWPLLEILIAIGVEPADVIGSSPADTQLAFRKLLEARAAERPQVVVFDDIQWAEPVFLDLIEHIADWSRDAPIFLLCVARPELLEVRPGWGGGKLNATTILLEALPDEDCELLISELDGGGGLTSETRRRILQAAGGNPLFIEEMLALVGENGGTAEIIVPPTIQALLQSRLDRLGAGERDLIGRGAVEGEVFHRSAVRELAPETERDDVPAHLLSLVRKEMIRSDRPTFPEEDAFRFRHLLIRDAAYDALPKATRADLHERFAIWLEEHGSLVEQDEIVGYHLERAYRNRAELDAADHRLEGLGRRAAAFLAKAARGAEARGDVNAAAGLLERAVALLPAGDPQRLEAVVKLCYPLIEAGRSDDSRAASAELRASSELRFQAIGRAADVLADIYGGAFDAARSRESAEFAHSVFDGSDDDLGLAWSGRADVAIHWLELRANAVAMAAVPAEHHARAAGDVVLAQALRQMRISTIVIGPMDADDGVVQIEELLTAARSVVERGSFEILLGKLHAMRGKVEIARTLVRDGQARDREAGLLLKAASTCMSAAFVEIRAGELKEAERLLRDGIDELDRLGGKSYKGTAMLDLVEVLALRGDFGGAERLCLTLRESINEDDVVDVVVLNALQGFLTAQGGDHEKGEALSARAVEVASKIDFYRPKGQAYEWQARTLALVGKRAEARDAATTALEIYETKGDQAPSAWIRELLSSLTT